MQAFDLDDPAHQGNLRWFSAYRAWQRGDPSPLAELLADSGAHIPQDARDFLAAFVRAGGRLPRQRGRPRSRTAAEERALVESVYEVERQYRARRYVANPRERACAKVAAGSRLSTKALQHIVDDAVARGYTFDTWLKYRARK